MLPATTPTLSPADRDRLRAKQDAVLAVLRDNGANPCMRFSADCSEAVTVRAMATELFPQFEGVFDRFLEGYGV